MSIREEARQEAERRYFPLDRPTMVSEQCAAMGFEEGVKWAREQDTRESQITDEMVTRADLAIQGFWRERYPVGSLTTEIARAALEAALGKIHETEQDTQEPSDAEACLVCERTDGTHKMSCRPQNRADAERHRSDAEVEAAARKVYETDAPSHEPDEWFTESDALRSDYRATARAVLLAAQEVRRG